MEICLLVSTRQAMSFEFEDKRCFLGVTNVFFEILPIMNFGLGADH